MRYFLHGMQNLELAKGVKGSAFGYAELNMLAQITINLR